MVYFVWQPVPGLVYTYKEIQVQEVQPYSLNKLLNKGLDMMV